MSFRFPNLPGRQTRKRVSSIIEDETEHKRRRRSSIYSEVDDFDLPGSSSLAEGSVQHEVSLLLEGPQLRRRPRLLSASSSFSSLYSSPPLLSKPPSEADVALQDGLALIRSASASSLQELRRAGPAKVTFPETSAHHHMRPGKQTIDFSVPDADAAAGVWPVSWSVHNLVVFTRGNRVHYKNLVASEDVGQLCKVSANHGNVRLLRCGGREYPNVVALCTAKGHIQLWDVSTKKMTTSWTVKDATAMQWNGAVLTVGGERGSIRHFDTRIKETAKMKEQTKKVTRHQARISSIAWNGDGKLMASGDASGLVLVWDARQNTPLDVGEMVQRRRKMQHVGVVHALAWCPWQTKILASGDSAPDGSGTIRLWNVQECAASRLSNHPDRLELDAQVTSLHFSAHCKELLSTHGPGKSTPRRNTQSHLGIELGLPVPSTSADADMEPSKIANSVMVHSYPSMRHVSTMAVAGKNVAGSVLSPNGQRIVFAVPEEMKLKVWDVWGREKESLRRHSSLLNMCAIR
ncbi:Cell division cycle protein 20 [Grifola frondosa]|uniref:Cell division cycle protein 20 n=1 Tax=Grifola frondosa TaxID=5627 RepID=A0A1C7MHC1_GRIFR|nr:Cell division cycle protein 20 [Grifola frondosa]